MTKLKFILPLAVVLICGCRPLTVTSFETGETLKMTAYPLSKTIRAVMPDGEVLKGKIGVIKNESMAFGFGSTTAFGGGTSATAFGSSAGYAASGTGYGYAILKSTKPGSHLMIELKASFGTVSGHGIGEARTNDGRNYKVVF